MPTLPTLDVTANQYAALAQVFPSEQVYLDWLANQLIQAVKQFHQTQIQTAYNEALANLEAQERAAMDEVDAMLDSLVTGA